MSKFAGKLTGKRKRITNLEGLLILNGDFIICQKNFINLFYLAFFSFFFDLF